MTLSISNIFPKLLIFSKNQNIYPEENFPACMFNIFTIVIILFLFLYLK